MFTVSGSEHDVVAMTVSHAAENTSQRPLIRFQQRTHLAIET